MSSDNLLDNLRLPGDLKKLSYEDINTLCREIRQKIISTVSVNGGHLASNLGVVELTIAVNKVFDRPKDALVWDVGHQCYTDKILTGRLSQIHSIRKENGLSGFPKTTESDYDAFNVGHSSTSISAALGIANAKVLNNEPGTVIAVIGDGSLSGGLAYEGLNNAGRFNKSFIIILNDNKMSISENVGSMARYLANIRTKPYYITLKNRFDCFLRKLPFFGNHLGNSWVKFKSILKNGMYNSTMFEDMGFTYYGPVDGHNVEELCRALEVSKQISKPVLLHVITKKGKGYEFAEKYPESFHGVSAFDIETGEGSYSGENFSSVFGKTLCSLAKKDDKICAITAAMTDGTGLAGFAKKYKHRFFDVSIAEEHAVTFAGGLAVRGLKPIFAVYSTFLQRAYDQLIHDVAMQNNKIVLAVDRAGIVGEDGETHQGLFDVPMLNSIPNCVIYSPSFFCELERDLTAAIYNQKNLTAVRYPRGKEGFKPPYYEITDKSFDIYFDSDIAVVTYGRLFSNVCTAREKLIKDNISIKIVKLNIIKPIDKNAVKAVLDCKKVLFFEESILNGGTAQSFGLDLMNNNFKGEYLINAVDNKFVKQACVANSLRNLGLDSKSMQKKIIELINGSDT